MDYNCLPIRANSSIFDCCDSAIELVGYLYRFRCATALSSEESCFHSMGRVTTYAHIAGDECLIQLELERSHRKDMVFVKFILISHSSWIISDHPYDHFTKNANRTL